MLFYNLNKPSEKVDFRTATIQGLGSEKGLFFPEQDSGIFLHPGSTIWKMISDEEIAWYVMNQYVGDSIPEKTLRQILRKRLHLIFRWFSLSSKIFTHLNYFMVPPWLLKTWVRVL